MSGEVYLEVDVGSPCSNATLSTVDLATSTLGAATGTTLGAAPVGCNVSVGASAAPGAATPNFTWQELSVVAVSCIVIAVIVVGNTLVIVAVITTRRLRTITNCFVMSLAVADWLVGVFVLPPAVAYQLIGTWELGWVLCDLWVSLDVLLCTASILSLCAISVDRYLAVTQPLNYSRRRRSKRLALAMILAVWLVAATITCPPILGWYEAGRHSNKTCRYNQNRGYVVFSAMGSFFVPLIVMLYVYARISCVVARRHDSLTAWDSRQTTRKLRNVDLDLRSPGPCSCSSSTSDIQRRYQTAVTTGSCCRTPGCRSSRCRPGCRSNCSSNNNGLVPPPTNSSRSPTRPESMFVDVSGNNTPGPGTGNSPSADIGTTANGNENHDQPQQQTLHQGHQHQHHHHHSRAHHVGGPSAGSRVSSFRRAESKTAKTLWVLVGGFVACWLPFFIVYLLTPFLPEGALSKEVMTCLTWLGWINSAVNPFIYAFYSPDFRVAFWRLTFRHCMPRKGGLPGSDLPRK